MFLHEMFENIPAEYVALKSNEKSISYGELRENIGKFRSYFEGLGVTKGDYVGLYYKNSPEFIYVYFAIVSMGAVIVPFNRMLTGSEAEYIAKDSKIKLIVTMNKLDMDSKYKQLILPEVMEDIMNTTITEKKKIEVSRDDVTTVIYTSGTTGQPKGAMLTHENLVSNTESAIKHFGVVKEDKFLCVLPMFHSFAWTVCVLTPLRMGASIVILENFMPKDAIRTIFEEEITIVAGVPTMYFYLLTLGDKDAYKHVKYFISGGASLPVDTLEAFRKKFDITIYEGYGLSEASPIVSINPLGRIKPGSIGLPIPNVQVKVVDAEGQEQPIGIKGELLVKGPNVMKGYKNLPEITEKTIRNNWLHTGDVAFIDQDGFIFIVDRIKDIVIVNGLNVYPREIEEAIYQYDDILEASVIGVPDQKRGEVTVAYIVVKEPENFNMKEFKDYLKKNLASYKLPKKIDVLDTLPKNSTGKIMKRTLRDLYDQQ